MLLPSSMAWRFLQMFSFIFHFYRKRNRDWKGSRRGSGSLHHAGYSQRWDRTRVSWSLPFFSPFLCSFTVKSMFSDYFPLNASFTFTLQRALLKHPYSFTQSLSMVALWNLWFGNLLLAPNYFTSCIPRMCAPDNQELFIGSLHYSWYR